ncbi:NAD-dependent epimerase/dehydratase family protein [Limnospira fusiformis]|uniref:NAD-dependent epimerase/dehydratase family protein n=1 Tax=Limnospira fusiformis TaxID=54297 RepID=UPI00144A1AF2|nr:NAD(P)-dependent oxidoreductase [Limnospira fusiformis SAG 85.79]
MKKAIVTGSTGFIGAVFVEYLIKNNVSVLALGRKDFAALSDTRKTKLKGADYLKIDMRHIGALKTEINRIAWEVGNDCIFFNLAWGGVSRLSDLNVEAQMQNVVWSVNALQSAVEIGCKKFIHVGTMEEAFTYKYFELDHNIHKQYNRHVVYSAAKIAAKYALKIKASELGMDFVYVLHSHVMAPDDGKDSFLQVTLKKLINREELIFSSGEQLFDVVSAKDCALGYFLICQKGLPGAEYWVGSGEPRQLREYVERMYSLYPSGQPMQFGKLPYNDIVLTEEDFSIASLVADTGYKPTMTYEQTVQELHGSFVQSNF